MLEPYVWMFKTKDFKAHVLYLFLSYFKFLVPAIFVYIMALPFILNTNVYKGLLVIALLLASAMPLCLLGYFWELSHSIINRRNDVAASSIYDGKIKIIAHIELPQINTLKLIWRGFASLVATVLMLLPLYIILVIIGALDVSFYSTGSSYNLNCYIALYVISICLVPALLWNYAKHNSIFSTMNIKKAIYIMGNYPFRYAWGLIRYWLLNIFYAFIVAGFMFLLNIYQLNSSVLLNLVYIMNLFIFGLILHVINIYFMFVSAYLLGTIAPSTE